MSKLIIVEGRDRSGKTTLIQELIKEKTDWMYFHNPRGMGSFSHDLYNCIKNAPTEHLKRKLILCSHIYNIQQVNQLLEQGNVVIMDRSLVSFYIYNCISIYTFEDFLSFLEHEGMPELLKTPRYYVQVFPHEDYETGQVEDALDSYFYSNQSIIEQAYEDYGPYYAKRLYQPDHLLTGYVDKYMFSSIIETVENS